MILIRNLMPITFLSIIALIIPQHAQSATQAKTGAKCTKVNSSQTVGGKKFTCIKSGSKLVWSIGKTVKGPAPKSTPTPTPLPTPTASPTSQTEVRSNPFKSSPFPDEFTRAQMVEAAVQSFDDYIKQNSATKDFKLVLDSTHQINSKEITKLVSEVYSVLPFPSGYPATLVVVTGDRELLAKSIKEYGPFHQTGSNPIDRINCLNCSGAGWASITSGVSHVIPHEIFHIWQKSAYKRVSDNNPDSSNPLNPPLWLDEGGADFFGEGFYSRTTGVYPEPRGGSWYWQEKQKQKPFRLQEYISWSNDNGYAYSLGRLASEYIVASKGMGKFLEIYSNVGLGQDFPSAFESALGISLNAFYEKFDKNLLKML